MNEHFPLALELEPIDKEGFTGNQMYRLTAPFTWLPTRGRGYLPVNVPIGFKTDLASVPKAMVAKGWKKAAVIHDYQCKEARKTARETGEPVDYGYADDCLYQAMRDDGASCVIANTYWLWVRAAHRLAEL